MSRIFAISVLASGLTSRRGWARNRFEQLIVRQGVGAGFAEALAQALAMTMIMRRGLREARLQVALLQHEDVDATPPARRLPYGRRLQG